MTVLLGMRHKAPNILSAPADLVAFPAGYAHCHKASIQVHTVTSQYAKPGEAWKSSEEFQIGQRQEWEDEHLSMNATCFTPLCVPYGGLYHLKSVKAPFTHQ